MIKVSRLADYAVVVLATLIKSDGAAMSATSVAQVSHLPEPTVAKVLKLLAKDGLVVSTRGAGGGYKAGKSADQVNIADIIRSVDGPIALTACVDGQEGSCSYSGNCPVHNRWDGVNNAVKHALESVTLADMMPEAKQVAA